MTTHRKPLESILDTVGKTPLVRVHASPDDVPVYAKLESFNPGASVKDRLGVYLVEKHLERGDIGPGGTVIEPTAGNTGIGIALAATQYDVDAVFVVPERFSVEKQTLMRALGATVVNTPTEEGMTRAIEHAHELAEELDDAVVPLQFSSPLNTEAHERTTGPEIWEALDGEVGAIVAGCGTGGTLMGIARYVLERNPDVHVTGVEPEGSLFAKTKGATIEKAEYKIEGIGTSDLATNDLFEPDLVDDIRQVSDRKAQEELKRLAREEGHMVASSAGAASLAAIQVAEEIEAGELDAPHDTVVTIFPDSAERYLSKGIYDSYEEWAEE